MKLHQRFGLAAIGVVTSLVGFVAACGSTDDALPASSFTGDQAKSELSRDMEPDVSVATLEALTTANAAFGLELFRTVSGDKNTFLSPHSISSALAMAYAGAGGETKAQMASALHFDLPDEELHAAFNRLDLDLEARGQNADPANGKGFRLNIANAAWALQGYPWNDAYLDTLAVNYGAGINLLSSFAGAESTINAWVNGETNGKIPSLLADGTLDGATRLVLTNAVYFLGAWKNPFNENGTYDETFHAPSGDVTVPMMHQTESFLYVDGVDYQAVRLPYEGGGMAMTIVLPAEGKMGDVKAAMTGSFFKDLGGTPTYKDVALKLPKFEFRWGTESIKGALSSLGMADAFIYMQADFTPMANTAQELYITDVLHQAFVSVDEKGTEAAAATAVVVGVDGGMAPPPSDPIPMVVDRPFLFGIHDMETGALLFLGQVATP